jgi:hypothetical protein
MPLAPQDVWSPIKAVAVAPRKRGAWPRNCKRTTATGKR